MSLSPEVRTFARERLERSKSDTMRRLAWCHGPEKALQIIAGFDDATNEDIAAWRALGMGRVS